MAKPTYARCRVCKRHRDDGVSLSQRGLCKECRDAIVNKELDDLKYHRGEEFLAWRRSMAASVGAVLVDDILNEG